MVKNPKIIRKTRIGSWCKYLPTGEEGRLLNFHNDRKVGAIVYKCDNNWESFEDYTPQITNYTDFIFTNK